MQAGRCPSDSAAATEWAYANANFRTSYFGNIWSNTSSTRRANDLSINEVENPVMLIAVGGQIINYLKVNSDRTALRFHTKAGKNKFPINFMDGHSSNTTILKGITSANNYTFHHK